MGWFNRTNTTALEQQQEVSIAPGMKLNLNFQRFSAMAIGSMAAATLASGGFIEPEPKAVEIGDKMPDGTVYAGVSPNTGKPMYVTPADAPLTMKWKEAKNYAKDLDAHGHRDWRVPTKDELNVLFNNRAEIGGFNVRGSTAGWYWSGTQYYLWTAWGHLFCDGCQSYNDKVSHSSVRCVRS